VVGVKNGWLWLVSDQGNQCEKTKTNQTQPLCATATLQGHIDREDQKITLTRPLRSRAQSSHRKKKAGG
jgi:hypothetical protein